MLDILLLSNLETISCKSKSIFALFDCSNLKKEKSTKVLDKSFLLSEIVFKIKATTGSIILLLSISKSKFFERPKSIANVLTILYVNLSIVDIEKSE